MNQRTGQTRPGQARKPSPEQHLTLAAARLSRSAPEAYNGFLAALRGYTEEQSQNCIQATLDELPRAQGRAQASARLLNVLSDCLSSAAKIERT